MMLLANAALMYKNSTISVGSLYFSVVMEVSLFRVIRHVSPTQSVLLLLN